MSNLVVFLEPKNYDNGPENGGNDTADYTSRCLTVSLEFMRPSADVTLGNASKNDCQGAEDKAE